MATAYKIKGFCLYSAYRDTLALLPDEEKGRLLMALFSFCEGEDKSAALSDAGKMAYSFISRRIREDDERAQTRSRINRENASRRRARPPKQEEGPTDAEDG